MNKQITQIFHMCIFALSVLSANVNVYAGGHISSSFSGKSDIIMGQVNVPYTTKNTYYEVLGFGSGSADGSGYGGIQAAPQGNNFIFALWDTQNKLPIKSVYSYPNSTVENFGGEGTGMHIINYSIGWTANDWINIVSRTWNYNKHTYYGYWAFNMTRNIWYHLITVDYPTPNLKFSGSNMAFIEDWLGDLQNGRAMNIKEGWNRDATSKKWNPWTKGSFYSNNPAAYQNKYDWGISGDHFFMNSGGTYSPSQNQNSLTLPASGANPVLTVGQVKSTALAYTASAKQLKVTWVNEDSKSPQFTYLIEVFNNPTFTGPPVLSKQDTTPHLRTLTLSTTNLPDGKYYVRNSITDIFDQKSNMIVNDFTIGALGISNVDATKEDRITLYPNPCNTFVHMLFNTNENHEALFFVYDVNGHLVLNNTLFTNALHTLDMAALRPGLYFVEVRDRNKNVIQRTKLIKE